MSKNLILAVLVIGAAAPSVLGQTPAPRTPSPPAINAPLELRVTAVDGSEIDLSKLRGKVVLLDFWGTWCPPCRASVPALRDLNKRYAKESAFVMIGIASENEAEPWRAFTTENKMVWPQYLDKERKIVRVFNVRAFPTYIVIDHEGIIRFRSIGTSWERSGNLDEIIRKQVKIVAKSTVGE